ncbi:MAG: bifunctional phosphoribosylaminoimidazolecarboxamide formyltransferase/IMP cyclohydrolase [Candidatus Omnitrophica bacterium CG1_02_46_14]|nr:MAG: bifunctional phosphoribosylaminoimidazolecarboxamide formyltransferase/IMP cyclohydrolase [Candidatus Omnitrophica bacterium CG1_02_46_14]
MNRIKRALISVYDKTGVAAFAKALDDYGIQIISTGGTAEVLKKAGIKVKEVSSVTKFPEMLNGRVKTLHPNIHGGLLALRDNPEHMNTLAKHHIKPIDLVVVNLYPFWDAVKTKTDPEEIIEMIDIGGPAMLRSGAKNFRSVAVVSDPRDYKMVLSELKKNEVCLGRTLLKTLAAKVFKLTAYYDGLIYRYLSCNSASKEGLPECLTLDFKKITNLRYGENPHQKGAFYSEKGIKSAGVVKAKQLHGKELSFNNILDLDAALEMAEAFEGPACSIVKHTNPCGFAVSRDARTAFKGAYRCDPLSAFGSIIGFNTFVDEKTAQEILNSGFVECVIAHGFSKKALKLLEVKKNMRLLLAKSGHQPEGYDFKKVSGGLLLQDRDQKDPTTANLQCVTKIKPKDSQIHDLLFAFKVCRYVKSNAIVIAKNNVTLGLGMGQPSRVDSCDTAFKKAGRRARGAVLASDGFFPKVDSIELAHKFGISAIIQPGGSIQDEAVIKACDKAKISMVFTRVRHFKH